MSTKSESNLEDPNEVLEARRLIKRLTDSQETSEKSEKLRLWRNLSLFNFQTGARAKDLQRTTNVVQDLIEDLSADDTKDVAKYLTFFMFYNIVKSKLEK